MKIVVFLAKNNIMLLWIKIVYFYHKKTCLFDLGVT